MQKIMLKIFNLKLLHSVWTYLGWFGCVYFGKLNWGLASFIFPLISWILLSFCFTLNRPLIFRLLVLLMIGLLFDSLASYFNLITILPSAKFSWLPAWMFSLWLLFVSSLPLLQSLFQKKYMIASLIGAFVGPLSYRAGGEFGILHLNGTVAILIYVLFWAIYMPLAVFFIGVKDHFNEHS